jgi:HTH-type transcriptional regulator / antitoxin HigA
MMQQNEHKTDSILNQWVSTPPQLRALLSPIKAEQDYLQALQVFEGLLSMVEGPAADIDPASVDLFHLIGENIHRYELKHHAVARSTPNEVINFLMEQHPLTQADLPEIGSQGVVSEVLNGKRQLNVRQIQALSRRFQVEPALFMAGL